MIHKKSPKVASKYYCEKCDYYSNKKSDFNKHCLTIKHNGTFFGDNGTFFGDNDTCQKWECPCGKIYKFHSGYYRHKKICPKKEDPEVIQQNIAEPKVVVVEPKEVVEQVVPSNHAFVDILKILVSQQQQLIDLTKEGKNVTNQQNITNHFNLNFFLNEKCKDALTINEFVSSIQLQLKELEKFEYLDFAQGMSEIFIQRLKETDVHKRPIHCSDLKREIFYIKEENDKWEKENEEKDRIKKAIKEVANKNIKQIPEWVNKHPNCVDYYHKDNDTYMNIISNTMYAGNKEEQDTNMNKIIKNIAKEVVIDKK
jgi:hypothetical protein